MRVVLPLIPLLVACDAPSGSSVLDGGPLPARWSELEAELAPHSASYTPRYPLWTDGLAKTRTIVADGAAYTKTLWDGARPLETRVLVRRDDGWELAAYLWEGDDARLLDGAVATPIAGSTHVVPSRRQCRTCHESAASPVLGHTALQLGDEALLPNADSQTRAAVGWVLGNCTHCHNGGSGPASTFDLRPDAFADNTLCVPTEGSMSAVGLRIKPGAPDESVLFLAAAHASEDGVAPMPPLGTTTPDPAGLAALRRYIESLPVSSCKESP